MGTRLRSFDEKKTVKVSGVSQLLRDQIEKKLQTKGNSTGYNADVNKLHVCPNGKDYILVEFVKDIPGNLSHDCLILLLLYSMLTQKRIENHFSFFHLSTTINAAIKYFVCSD
jgi:hypothetical protein